MRPVRILRPLAALCLVAAFGCSDQGPEPGVLVVPFELGNQKDCDSLGVVAVRAELDGGDFVEEVDCEAGQVRFNFLMPGTYDLALFGLDADDVPILDSLATENLRVSVVGEGSTVVAEPTVKLTAAPARLLLRWELGFGSCESANIDHFELSAWREDGSELLLETELPCEMSGEGRDQYRLVPDLDRELSGDEVGEVAIQPIDGDGLAMGGELLFTFAAPGAGQQVKLSMSCDAGGCDGTGEPD